MSDLYKFNEINFLAQLSLDKYEGGRYKLIFFSENGRPSGEETEELGIYYYYPSGGTIRDSEFNIIEYIPKFDTYRGFQPPHMKD
jgi:hypothetical protein